MVVSCLVVFYIKAPHRQPATTTPFKDGRGLYPHKTTSPASSFEVYFFCSLGKNPLGFSILVFNK